MRSPERKGFRVTHPTEIRQQAIALLDRLSPAKLTAVLQLLEVLAEPPQSTSPAQEAAMLQTIQHGLPPEEQRRLDELRDRCECGELSEAEHQELIGYEDLLEQQRVKPLLASLYGICADNPIVLDNLGISSALDDDLAGAFD